MARLSEEFELETGNEYWASEVHCAGSWYSTGSYSNKYVKWLEAKLESNQK